jgi:MmyB-like transcription regulator ligand binding domain/Helix-turn-helix domain
MPPTAPERPAAGRRGRLAGDADWAWRAELADLLRACRARLARPAVPGTRRGGLRQEDVANLAGLSLRRYAAFERGEFTPPAATVDQVAAALQMSGAERSALHVLATGQDPPRPVARPAQDPRREPSKALRDLVSHMGPFPAALTDETWTLVHYNPAMNAWAGGWYDAAEPAERHLVFYLFSEIAEELLPDLHAVRRASMAMLRYQYTRNLAAPGFARLVARLTACSAEAAALWARHEVAFPPHEYPVRLRHGGHGILDGHVLFVPVSPRLWTYTMILPPGARPPSSAPASARRAQAAPRVGSP